MFHRSIKLQPLALSFVLAGSIFTFMPVKPATRSSGQQKMPPCYHKELGDIDFLIGDWTIEANVRLADGKWEQSSAVSKISPDLSGCLLNERFTGTRADHTFSALAIMGFNSVTGKLQRMWSDSEHGLLIIYEGNRKGNEMSLDTEVLLDGKKVKLRNSYLEIAKDSFRLESARSVDDGKTWITVMKLEYKRK